MSTKGSKRIYAATVKKWLIGLGIGIPTAVGLISYLIFLGAIDLISYSGDSVCAGTELDPCEARITFLANTDIFVYPGDEWGLTTDKPIKSITMYRTWGKGLREINLSKSCQFSWCGAKPGSTSNKFSYAFRKGREYTIVYKALKNSPSDDIKWWVDDLSVPDPIWEGIESKKVNSKKVFNEKFVREVINCDVVEDTNYVGYNFSCSGSYDKKINSWINVQVNFTKVYEGLKNESPKKKKEKNVYWDENKTFKYKFKTKEEVTKLEKEWQIPLWCKKDVWSPINHTWEKEEYYCPYNMTKLLYENIINFRVVNNNAVWRIGDASTIINFTTSSVLVNDTVNDVFVYDITEDSTDYTTWYNDTTTDWWQEINSSKSPLIWNKLGSSAEVNVSEIGYNLTPVGGSAVFQSVKFGNGFKYEGFPYGFEMPAVNLTAGTIEFWIKHDNVQPANQDNQDIIGDGGGSASFPSWRIYWAGGATDVFVISLYIDAENYLYIDPSYSQVGWTEPNQVQHWVITWDTQGRAGNVATGSDYVNLYVDGREVEYQWDGVNGVVPYSSLNANTGDVVSFAFSRNSNNYNCDVTFENLRVYDYAKTDFSDRFLENNSVRSETFPEKSYLVASEGGLDILDSDKIANESLWWEIQDYSFSQVYAKDGNIYGDNSSNFVNYSFVGDNLSGLLGVNRENNLWVNNSEYYWSNSTGWCRQNSAINWTFSCENFTALSNVQAVAASDDYVFVSDGSAGLLRYGHDNLSNELNYSVGATTLEGNSDNVTDLDVDGGNLYYVTS